MHEYDFSTALFNQMLMLKQRVKVLQRNGDFFLSKPFRRILHQFGAVLPGKINDRPFCPCVQDFFHILLPFHIASRNHGDPDDPVDPFHQINGFFMFFIGI